jgi:anti-anti-sigma factor
MPEPSYRHLQTSGDGAVLVLTVTHPLLLDDEIIDALQADLTAAVEHHRPRQAVLDFRHVRAMGSGAFRPVISLHRRLREAGGELVLSGLADAVADIFHLTGLISRVPTRRAPLAAAPDLPAALAQLSGAGGRPTI